MHSLCHEYHVSSIEAVMPSSPTYQTYASAHPLALISPIDFAPAPVSYRHTEHKEQIEPPHDAAMSHHYHNLHIVCQMDPM
jgi:hypothetical protein